MRRVTVTKMTEDTATAATASTLPDGMEGKAVPTAAAKSTATLLIVSAMTCLIDAMRNHQDKGNQM